MECSCCGTEQDSTVALQCHGDIRVCRTCIGWLRQRAGGLDVTPILCIVDMAEAVMFYESAGFEVRVHESGGYGFVSYGDESAFDLTVAAGATSATNGAGCYIIVPDVDEWHGRLVARGLPVSPLLDEPWGMREFTLTDPSGNGIRFGHGG